MSKIRESLLDKMIERMFECDRSDKTTSDSTDIYSDYIGKYVIVRTYSAGVFFAILKKIDKDTAILDSSRRIWKWVGATELTDLAVHGVTDKVESRISVVSHGRIVLGVNEIILCSEKCIKNINSIKTWSENE
jgi:hypothetical protein